MQINHTESPTRSSSEAEPSAADGPRRPPHEDRWAVETRYVHMYNDSWFVVFVLIPLWCGAMARRPLARRRIHRRRDEGGDLRRVEHHRHSERDALRLLAVAKINWRTRAFTRARVARDFVR